jgi:hypothetical protein
MPVSTRQIDNVDTLPPGSQVGEDAPWRAPMRHAMGWAEIVALGGVCFVMLPLVWYLIGADVRAWIAYSWGGLAIKAAFALVFLYAAALIFRRAVLVNQRGYQVPIWQVARVLPQLIEVDEAFASTPGRMVRAQTISYPSKVEQIAAPPPQIEMITTVPMLPPSEWLTWFDSRPHGLLAAETGGGKSTTVKAVLKSRMDRGELGIPHRPPFVGLVRASLDRRWRGLARSLGGYARGHRRVHTPHAGAGSVSEAQQSRAAA